MFVAGRLIPPGETKVFAENEVPAHLKPASMPAPLPSEPEDKLLELLDQGVREIAKAIEARNPDGTPVLSSDELERLAAAEANGKTRKTLMEALNHERIRRANEAQDREDHLVFVESLKDMPTEQLEELKVTHKEDPQKVAAIEHQELVNLVEASVKDNNREVLLELRKEREGDDVALAVINAGLAKLGPAE